MKITLIINNNKLICPYQNEVENISIKNYGNHKNIYFSPIKINNEYYLKWNDNYKGWEFKNYAKRYNNVYS